MAEEGRNGNTYDTGVTLIRDTGWSPKNAADQAQGQVCTVSIPIPWKGSRISAGIVENSVQDDMGITRLRRSCDWLVFVTQQTLGCAKSSPEAGVSGVKSQRGAAPSRPVGATGTVVAIAGRGSELSRRRQIPQIRSADEAMPFTRDTATRIERTQRNRVARRCEAAMQLRGGTNSSRYYTAGRALRLMAPLSARAARPGAVRLRTHP